MRSRYFHYQPLSTRYLQGLLIFIVVFSLPHLLRGSSGFHIWDIAKFSLMAAGFFFPFLNFKNINEYYSVSNSGLTIHRRVGKDTFLSLQDIQQLSHREEKKHRFYTQKILRITTSSGSHEIMLDQMPDARDFVKRMEGLRSVVLV